MPLHQFYNLTVKVENLPDSYGKLAPNGEDTPRSTES